MKKMVFLLVLLAMTGCASTTQLVRMPDQSKMVEDAGKARIYVVRPSSIGGAARFEVWDGHERIGTTGGKGFVCWEREPGTTTIRTRDKSGGVTFAKVECKEGEVYFFNQNDRMKPLSEQEGRKWLSECRPPSVQ